MHPDARTLHAAIENVTYRGLDLSHLYPAVDDRMPSDKPALARAAD
jgi:hypothetical protein